MSRTLILIVAILIGSQIKAMELDAPVDYIDGKPLCLSKLSGQQGRA